RVQPCGGNFASVGLDEAHVKVGDFIASRTGAHTDQANVRCEYCGVVKREAFNLGHGFSVPQRLDPLEHSERRRADPTRTTPFDIYGLLEASVAVILVDTAPTAVFHAVLALVRLRVLAG